MRNCRTCFEVLLIWFYMYFVFSSLELKAQQPFLIACCLSSVCPSLHLHETFHFFIFSKTTKPNSPKLDSKSFEKMGFMFVQWMTLSSLWEDDSEIEKCMDEIYKSSSLEPLDHIKQTWHKASLGEEDSSLFKLKATLLSMGDNNNC